LHGVVYKTVPVGGGIGSIALDVANELKAAGYVVGANRLLSLWANAAPTTCAHGSGLDVSRDGPGLGTAQPTQPAAGVTLAGGRPEAQCARKSRDCAGPCWWHAGVRGDALAP